MVPTPVKIIKLLIKELMHNLESRMATEKIQQEDSVMILIGLMD
jgi:hypothetical protein